MKSMVRITLGLVVLASIAHRCAAADEGFTSLFDGKTLSGWTINCLPKDKEFAAKAWSVDQGTLLANTLGHPDHFYILLGTEKQYGDFVLRLRFQVERGVNGNSGIQIRSRYNAETGWMEGPQLDINPPNPPLTGKLWNEGPGPHRWLSNEPVNDFKFFYADEGAGWNDLEISAVGMRIRSVLNGVTVVDYDGSGVLDDELHKKAGVGARGVIGLQIHASDELKLRFKDLRIKELPSMTLQQYEAVEPEKYPWGWIRWLMNSKIDPTAEMTVGIVEIAPNQMNPLHVHPNSAEYLHVLSGSCEHLMGDKWVSMKAGDTIRIPKGVPHRARTGGEACRTMVIYDTGTRQMVPLGEAIKPSK